MAESSDDSLGSWKDMEDLSSLDELISAVTKKYPGCARLLEEKEDVRSSADQASNIANMEVEDFSARSSNNDGNINESLETITVYNVNNTNNEKTEIDVGLSEETPPKNSNEAVDPTWHPAEESDNDSDEETINRPNEPNIGENQLIQIIENDANATVNITDENQVVRDNTDIENNPLQEENNTIIGKVKKTRRRKASKKDWHDNIQKKQRERGKEYIGWSRPQKSKGKRGPDREDRKMGPTCVSKFCEKSKHRQCQSISEEARTVIFTRLWETMSWDQKKIYIVSLVNKVHSEKTTGQDSRRKFTMEYNLKSTDGNVYPVCKNMFLNTLGMKEWSVLNWINKSDELGMSFSTENVLLSKPARKTQIKEGKVLLERFLENLPKLPSHYCRQSTEKTYLEPVYGNTMADIYKAYKTFCAENGGVDPVSRFTFDQSILQSKIAIQLPKKDKCDLCCMYEVKAVDEHTYNIHLQQKTEARNEKLQDKESGEEGKCIVLTQDVQSVKVCPSLNASALYFKTKLCNHNFTIFDINRKHATCYWFTEADADLSANTFASCIVDYLSVKCDGTKPIIIWSDGCTYQNRNAVVSNALLAFSVEKKIEVYQKYLVKGHTQMEADSVHATIERKLKNKPIYLPSDFLRYTVEATKEEKYEVKQLTFDFVKNFSDKCKLMYESIRPGRKPGDPTVNDIKVIKYSPDGKIQVKINSFLSSFIDLPQRKKLHSLPNSNEFNVLRKEPIKIARRKWLDLQELKKVIPFDCHAFYDNLSFE